MVRNQGRGQYRTMIVLEHPRTALLLIDLQQGFDTIEAAGNSRNNPQALVKITALLAAFRAANTRILHIRHASTQANSVFRPENPGFAAMPAAAERPGETIITKQVNSAFIGTPLEALLRQHNIATLVIAGATTNHCVETTTRMAGNLGFDAHLVEDACWTFDRAGPDGHLHKAADIHLMTLANLSGEFATIVTTQKIIAQLQHQAAA